MRPLRFRVRTLLLAVAIVAVVLWSVMTGTRWYVYYRRARFYTVQHRAFRQAVDRGDTFGLPRVFNAECADYYAMLSAKYRRAVAALAPLAPDPFAPGHKEYLEQQRKLSASAPKSP